MCLLRDPFFYIQNNFRMLRVAERSLSEFNCLKTSLSLQHVDLSIERFNQTFNMQNLFRIYREYHFIVHLIMNIFRIYAIRKKSICVIKFLFTEDHRQKFSCRNRKIPIEGFRYPANCFRLSRLNFNVTECSNDCFRSR